MLLGVDDSLGRILATLERKHILNNTMVVFTSDHGYFYGEHGLNEERRLAYEETIRIPLVICYPPLTTAGSTPPEMALSIDIAPTLLEVAGLQPGTGMQGRSLVPYSRMRHGSGAHRSLSSSSPTPCFRASGTWATWRREPRGTNTSSIANCRGWMSCHLDTDPYEETNLIDRPDARQTLQQMQAELRHLLEQTQYETPVSLLSAAPR